MNGSSYYCTALVCDTRGFQFTEGLQLKEGFQFMEGVPLNWRQLLPIELPFSRLLSPGTELFWQFPFLYIYPDLGLPHRCSSVLAYGTMMLPFSLAAAVSHDIRSRCVVCCVMFPLYSVAYRRHHHHHHRVIICCPSASHQMTASISSSSRLTCWSLWYGWLDDAKPILYI